MELSNFPIIAAKGITMLFATVSCCRYIVAFAFLLVASISWAIEVALPKSPVFAVPPIAQVGVTRTYWLNAEFRYRNKSNTPLHIFHNVTAPAMDTTHQRVLRIEADTPNATLMLHENGIDYYVSMTLVLPPTSQIKQQVRYLVQKQDTIYFLPSPVISFPLGIPISKDPYTPHEAPEITALAKTALARCEQESGCALQRAFEIPGNILRFRKSPKTLDTVTAIAIGEGDCTEYANIFVALSKALGIPARRTAVFNLRGKTRFKMPNHNGAEIFLQGIGWVPADPNLGQPKSGYREGLGRTGVDTLLFSREGTWTWSNHVLPKGAAYDVKMLWELAPAMGSTSAKIP